MTQRQKKFKSAFSQNIKDPDYKNIRKIYLENELFTLASARKLFNMVKFTLQGKIKKASENNKRKRDEIIQSYDYKIKKGDSLDEMNRKINKTDNKRKIDIDLVLNNLDKNKKYLVDVKYDIAGAVKNRLFTATKKYLTSYIKNEGLKLDEKEGEIDSSDKWVKVNYAGIQEYKIFPIEDDPFIDEEQQIKQRKMNRNVGVFKFYNNHEGVDLSQYQIYNKEQEINGTNCLIYSLEKANVDKELINKLIITFSSFDNTASDICIKSFEYIKQKAFQDVANTIKKNIVIWIYDKEKQRTLKYNTKDETDETINLAIYNNHIFINEKTIYKRYAILNYEKLKHKKDWFSFSSKEDKARGKQLTVLEVIRLLDNNNYFEEMPLSVNLTDDVKKLTTNELLANIKEDQRQFQHKQKTEYKNKLYFADLENINYVDKSSVPFLSGIIADDEKEPFISTGLDCIKKMFDYVAKRDKYGVKNIVYFHNMKYDFSLMKQCSDLKITVMCEKDGAIYSVNLLYGKIKIELRDSFKLFSQKLSKFTKTFNLPEELSKQEAINYDYYNDKTINEEYASIKVYGHGIKDTEKQIYIENIKPFICDGDNKKFRHMDYYRYYLKYDCLVLQKGMQAFNKVIKETFGKSIYNFLTISSFSDDYFKERGVYEDVYEVKAGLKKFLGLAVYGGRVNACKEFKKQVINERINDFDGVSLYPSAIARLCDEIGVPKGPAKRIIDKTINNKDYYVVEILIKSINKKQQNPFIAFKNGGSIQYINDLPNNEPFKVVVDKITLEDYIEHHQIDYEILDGVYYDQGFNNNFICIKEVFNKRLEQKALKTPAGDVLQEIYKLMLNSAYGKTLLKSTAEKNTIINKKDFNTYVYNNFNTIKHGVKLSESQYMITQYEPDESYNRAIAGIAILSMSKRIMNEVMATANDNNINIYYQDTDSMHLNDAHIDKLAQKYELKYNKKLIGKQLGQFHSDFNHSNKKAQNIVAVKSIFLGKKCYIDYIEGTLPDGSKEYCVHSRMKGINEIALVNVAKEYEGKTMNDKIFKVYEDLANNSTIEFILNPEEKPSFKFTSQGVHKVASNTFKRNVSFLSDELDEVSDDETL